MVGQDHITRTLKNQVIAGRVGHAYLFTGGRGTGKTTSAKILARAVNCLNPQNGEPCNECEICKEDLKGSLTDIIEMDAASNNGVDEIRAIREEVSFLPTRAKYRVYIIDEVHMLSAGAFNALLKTLEEPPEHVKFILATTEPQKLPATILSRCQRFDFKRIPENDIISRLKVICKSSNIKASEDALRIMAVLSEGHMRDAISILERCYQEKPEEEIEVSDVKELVGLPEVALISELAKAVFEYDEIKALSVIKEISETGKDLNNFLWETIKYFKDILVYKATGKIDLYTKEEQDKIAELSKLDSEDRVFNIIYSLSELENDLKWSTQKTIMLEVGIMKLCKKESIESSSSSSNKPHGSSGNTGGGSQELQHRVDEIEKKISNLKFLLGPMIKEQIENVGNAVKYVDAKVSRKKEEIAEEKEKEESYSLDNIDNQWNTVKNKLKENGKVRLYTALANTKAVEKDEENWDIEFYNGINDYNRKILEDTGNKKDLIMQIFKATGKEVKVTYKDLKGKKKGGVQNTKMDDLGIDINIIE
jgi:DNA polymerase-3 subunit gamma/tau